VATNSPGFAPGMAIIAVTALTFLLISGLYGDVEGPVCSESYRRQSACYHKTGLLRMALNFLDVPGMML
jgi:hypothetical protein